jgi:ATP-dependent Clp protease adaptor protein ClpS
MALPVRDFPLPELELDRSDLWVRDAASGSGPRTPNDPPDRAPDLGEEEDVDVEDVPLSETPRRFKVIFHNDDYTTQEFVVFVLERFFHKSEAEARHIMLTVHFKGAAVAGVYTKDVAETKAQQVMDLARDEGMPLLLTTEPE